MNRSKIMRRQFVRGLHLILCFCVFFAPVLGLTLKRSSRVSNPKKPKPVLLPKGNKPAVPYIQSSAQPTGQSSTLLPNGSLLLIGGEGPNGPKDVAIVRNPQTGQTFELRSRLNIARAWHSATMLPDGSILILGGVGRNGRMVNAAEVFSFQTQTFLFLPQSRQPSPRAYHTATSLVDGSVLITGGVKVDGRTPGGAELWNFKTGLATALANAPNAPRQKHQATLLSDGTVFLHGGVDALGNQQTSSEIFNPVLGSFSWFGNANEPIDTRSPFLSLSLPADGQNNVPVDSHIGLLLSQRLRADTVNSETISLSGPAGAVSARVVPAENGKLVFVTPVEPLQYGTNYSVLLAGAVDTSNQSVISTAFTFTTAEDPNREPDERTTSGSDTALPDTETWTPNEKNLRGNWRSDYPETHWQKLPPLQAPPGVTALAGQVLTLDGKPLRNVTLQISGAWVQTTTDQTGRFLLQPITRGHQVLRIDGRTAGTTAKIYGIFRVGVDVMGGQTDVLGYTIWMPKLDTEHAVNIASPTNTDVSATTPHIPGLELQLPAGTVIRGVDGETVTEVSITSIPVDRPPFPLPSGINVPVFFTTQPGGAQIIPPRARVIYPNYTNEAPGSRIDFWNYDPEDKGWYIYGRGTVTADGKRVVPDPGVVIYEFSGIMINTGQSPPSDGPVPCEPCEDGDPVNLGTGLFVHENIDLAISHVQPLNLARTYRPKDTASRSFGIGSTHMYDMFLWSAEQYKEADLILPDGGRVHFDRVTSGSGFSDAVFWCKQPGPFYMAEIRWMGLIVPDPAKIEMWHMTLTDGTIFVFGENAPLQRIRDSYGNSILISRAGVNTFGSPIGNVTKVASGPKHIEFTYDTSNRITKAKDNIGREVNYTYDANGRLWKVTDAKQGVTEYTYDASHRMLAIKDPRGVVYLTNEYDTNGRVRKQTLADDTPENSTDNPTYNFAYTTDSGGKITQTDVTDERGNIRRVTFNSKGYVLTDTFALGKPEQQTYSVERQSETNLILSLTDPLGRKTAYTYDSDGKVTSVTELALTANAITTRLTYDVDYSLKNPTTITDPLGRVTTASYHEKGNPLTVTDPLGRRTILAYTGGGLPTSITDPQGNTSRFYYETSSLLRATDSLGRTTERHQDGAGRTLTLTNPLGQTVRMEYDAFSDVVKVTDPIDGVTELSYDPNGNLIGVKDARQKTTSYTYDSMDRLKTRTDQMQGSSSTESYGYDVKGNLVRFTDRRGKVTVYRYDNLDRLNFVGFGETGVGVYESTIDYTYDAGNRLRTAVDSVSGTLTLEYDNFNRLLSVATPQGTISYTYDKVGRRKTMTVPGQGVVNYSYDNADRLTSINQGSATVSLSYDDADRVTTKTLTNGVVAEYDYDAASQITGITYKSGDSILGDLTYEYDRTGRVTRVGGSYARIDLPQTLSSATYDDANKLTQRDGLNYTYDANGNLLSDGVNTYAWNARNQLISINGTVNAAFQYDAFGRRIQRTINGSSTWFLYDGSDVVQEQAGGAPFANLLLGGLDSVFTRTEDGVSRTVIADGLGSTLGLMDETGTLQTQYSYEPFGKTTITGAASNNASQYTGRESDGAGLYYYRARYYSPALQRFISEDPLRFTAGDPNFYSYVSNDPINSSDPFGLEKNNLGCTGGANLLDLINCGDQGWWGGVKAGLSYAGNFNPLSYAASKVIDVAEGGELGPAAVIAALPVVGRYARVKKLGKEAHHVIQDAAVRDLPGYSRSRAPAIILPGPSTKVGSPHYCATQIQRQRGGGTYAAERRIGYKALRRGGVNRNDARDIIKEADDYFFNLGVTPQTPTRIPGGRH